MRREITEHKKDMMKWEEAMEKFKKRKQTSEQRLEQQDEPSRRVEE